MRRRRAILMFALIIGLPILYFGYCLRAFYHTPEIAIAPDIPDDAKKAILDWYEGSDMRKPERFEIRRGIEHLANPGRYRNFHVTAIKGGEDRIRVYGLYRECSFERTAGEWLYAGTISSRSPP